MRVAAGSVPAMQTPLHVLPDEPLHQFRLASFQEAAKGLLEEVGFIAEPTLRDKRLELAVELIGDIRMDSLHAIMIADSQREARDFPDRLCPDPWRSKGQGGWGRRRCGCHLPSREAAAAPAHVVADQPDLSLWDLPTSL